jgi:hypothetical protein
MGAENIVYIHNGVLYGQKEWNISFARKLIDLKGNMLSKISQTQKEGITCFLL